MELVCPCGYENFERMSFSAGPIPLLWPTSSRASAARRCTSLPCVGPTRLRRDLATGCAVSAGRSLDRTPAQRWSATRQTPPGTTASQVDQVDAEGPPW